MTERPTIAEIQEAVVKAHGVRMGIMTEGVRPRGDKPPSIARKTAVWIACRVMGYSQAHTGRAFGISKVSVQRIVDRVAGGMHHIPDDAEAFAKERWPNASNQPAKSVQLVGKPEKPAPAIVDTSLPWERDANIAARREANMHRW